MLFHKLTTNSYGYKLCLIMRNFKLKFLNVNKRGDDVKTCYMHKYINMLALLV